MTTVAIFGAGELGGAIAHVLARRNIVSEIRLVDETGNVAAGKALDLMQSAALEGFTTSVKGATHLTSGRDPSIAIVADCATRGEWHGEDGLMGLRHWGLAAQTIVVCAGPAQRELVERGVRELQRPRARLFGTAPEALVAAIRAAVAAETSCSARDVALTALGVPPTQTIVPWEDATIGGIAAVRLLAEPMRRRLAARVTEMWPPRAYALASAAVKAVEALTGRSRQTLSCFVAPDDSMGRRMRAAAMPARIGQGGIASVEVPPLTVHDKVKLDNATLL
jgi:malate dehydrogenase